MEEVFISFVQKVKHFRHFVINITIGYDKHLKDIIKDLEVLIKLNIDINKKAEFIDRNIGNLYMIHNTLVGEWANLHLSSINIKNNRSSHDKFMKTKLGIPNIQNYAKQYPTRIFTEFCKGITYFSDEITQYANPIYHRNVSCGNKLIESETKFRHSLLNTKISKSKKNSYLRRCYIERIIYDKIYNDILKEQDLGHLNELQIVTRLYQDNHPNERISIEIYYKENTSYPYKIIIETRETQEIYNKIIINGLYKDEVYCKKIMNNKKYSKIQTFIKEESWLLDII
jgi:hypothetical protein